MNARYIARHGAMRFLGEFEAGAGAAYTRAVVEGISLSRLSVANFLTVLANPNVAEALANTLIACGGGTLIAVAIDS